MAALTAILRIMRRMGEEKGKSRIQDAFIAKLVSACKKSLTNMGK
jgi:hypothetical protein